MGNHRVATTAKTGYMQRRIIKVCEDIQVKYDGTVRDTTGKIYQLAYGNNGLDPTSTVKVNGKQEACDISRMVARLNLKFELEQEQKQENKKLEQENKKKRDCLIKEVHRMTDSNRSYDEWSINDLVQRVESLKLDIVKPVKVKPVKVKPVKVKPVKVKPVKVMKVKEVKPLKVMKVKEVKPLKVKPVKVMKVKEVKPLKVMKVKEVKPLKVVKQNREELIIKLHKITGRKRAYKRLSLDDLIKRVKSLE
jgi:hypothetical protein